MDTLKFRERIQERAQRGESLTDDEISFITHGSLDLAGTDFDNNPDKARWASTSDRVLQKPANTITADDAKNVTSKEVGLPCIPCQSLTTPGARL